MNGAGFDFDLDVVDVDALWSISKVPVVCSEHHSSFVPAVRRADTLNDEGSLGALAYNDEHQDDPFKDLNGKHLNDDDFPALLKRCEMRLSRHTAKARSDLLKLVKS